MAQKTALRRLVKFLPMDADIFDSSSESELENTDLANQELTFVADDFNTIDPNNIDLKIENNKSKLDDFNQNTLVENIPENVEVPENLFNDFNGCTP